MATLRTLVESTQSNAAISWALTAGFAVAAVVSLLRGEVMWAVYSLAVVAVALVPPLLARDRTVTVAWSPLALAALSLVAQWFGWYAAFVPYLSVATLALLVAVEVDAFSAAEMPPWFAVSFVVMTTMAIAGLWGVFQYFADAALGTSFLADRTELMWDLVAATAVGVGVGLLFALFFHEYDAGASGREGVTEA